MSIFSMLKHRDLYADAAYWKAEAERLRYSYDDACQLIAKMHAAAFGGEVRGPVRGVVEDIEDLYVRAVFPKINRSDDD